jgi:hypothetical protein
MLDVATIRSKVPKFAAALEARHTGAGWETLLAATAEMLHDLGSRPRLTNELLGTIGHPIRLAVGDRDATVDIDECAGALRLLKNGELEVHPRTPHPFEKVPLDRVATSLSEFFAA